MVENNIPKSSDDDVSQLPSPSHHATETTHDQQSVGGDDNGGKVEAPPARAQKVGYQIADEVKGFITRLSKSFAFVDIDSADQRDGFLHISQIREGYVQNIAEELALEQEVVCWILDDDRKGNRYELTMKGKPVRKRPPKRPIDSLRVGDKIEGVVEHFTRNVAYIAIGSEVNALLLDSDMGNQVVWDISEVLNVGDIVPVRVISIDLEGIQESMSS
eukprot:TRINITY_DN2938_c0_g1_i2.p1 TRINITY_DN2938_c0_g1~~TRINITY_DN2938_c0_g1_i2.p1  ORF type:complete len:240 (+),score=88.51 TRINITY_DN2938_c0_g1_i2:70-720(+)